MNLVINTLVETNYQMAQAPNNPALCKQVWGFLKDIFYFHIGSTVKLIELVKIYINVSLEFTHL